jgi:hypothetical protein
MGRSLALGLYLLLAERGGADVAADRPARRSGGLVWIHAAPDGREESLRQLAALLRDERPDLQLPTGGPMPRFSLACRCRRRLSPKRTSGGCR